MRYRFRGLVRDTGKPVEGHVDADNEEFAFHLLANNGIVTESLRADPRPEDARLPAAPKANLLPPLAMAMMSGKRPASPASNAGATAVADPTATVVPSIPQTPVKQYQPPRRTRRRCRARPKWPAPSTAR